jgi:hypothetical protein
MLLIVLLAAALLVPTLKAAVIFSDGFESEDFSEWTGTSGTVTPIVTDDYPHHDSYVMRCATNKLGTGGHYSFAYKNFTDPDVGYVHARVYVRFSNILTSGSVQRLLYLSNAGTYGGSIRIEYDDSDEKTKFRYRNEYFGVNFWSGVEVNADTWYCIEMRLNKTGHSAWWINGELQGENLGNTNNQAINRIQVGGTNLGNVATYIYLDCVVVADSYIGPETPEEGEERSFTLVERPNSTDAIIIKQAQQRNFVEIIYASEAPVKTGAASFIFTNIASQAAAIQHTAATMLVITTFYNFMQLSSVFAPLFFPVVTPPADISGQEAFDMAAGLIIMFFCVGLAVTVALVSYKRKPE